MSLSNELMRCHKPLTEKQQQGTLCRMVDFDFFCNEFYGEIGDWLEDNHPDDIIQRAIRIESGTNMTKKELKADESEFKTNAKYGRE